jgi:putative transposase
MHQAFRFRLYPTKKQVISIHKSIGSSRFVFNHFLAKWNDTYRETGKGLTYLCYFFCPIPSGGFSSLFLFISPLFHLNWYCFIGLDENLISKIKVEHKTSNDPHTNRYTGYTQNADYRKRYEENQ